ncbi:MAG: transcriptional regulator [Deltaproteobacteria bacterium RIFOXYD12_FULL_57_12]|nr:MAG: transcriptional regulator [Deltaproteobacteria bacterium RIFOXYD12_FULL_57_12]
MNVKVIKNAEDHAAAMARLSALMSLDPKVGSDEESELELLALVIEAYERQIVPPAAIDPVDAILFRMDQMKLSRKDLVPCMGSISKVSEVLSRKRPLSLSMIRRLHKILGIPTDILIKDSDVDEGIVDEAPNLDYSRFPLKEMHDRGCFGEFHGNSQRLKEYAEDLIRKFMLDVSPKRMEPALLRAPIHRRGDRKADEYALLAWRMCVLKKAHNIALTRDYKAGSITTEWMRELAKLSLFEDGPRLAKEYLSRYGIALIIEPHFEKTFLDGAAMLGNGYPIVALTLRHDRIDNFWFALMHELAHVSKHLSESTPIFIDDLDRVNLERIEVEADAMATEALVPSNIMARARVRETLAEADAIALADQLGIHPAIVAGRLRHETKNFHLLSSLIGKKGQVSRCFAQ